MNDAENKNVIFFDGVCGLCNGLVDFIMRVDEKKIFKFSPLQSDFAHRVLPLEDVRDLHSIVVMVDGQKAIKARAVISIFQKLGGPYGLLAVFKTLPDPLLNWAYDLVAKNRYRLFGTKDSCRLPTPDERSQFLL
jgi:predicted DCC family thiol-disulfide oxidoreductase YuxK